MTNVIDMLLEQAGDKVKQWKEMPDIVTSDIVAVASSVTDNFEEVPVNKQQARKMIDELIEAIVVLHKHKFDNRR